MSRYSGVKKMKSKHILNLILEATPRDEWIRANEIAEKTGLTTQAVGAIIAIICFNISKGRGSRIAVIGFFCINALISAARVC